MATQNKNEMQAFGFFIWLTGLGVCYANQVDKNAFFWVGLLIVVFPILLFFVKSKTPLRKVRDELKGKRIHRKLKKYVLRTADQQAGIDDASLIGTDVYNCKEVLLSNKALNQHVLVLGTTGSGKTMTVLNFVESAIQQGIPLIYIDGKGEDKDGRRIVEYAKSLDCEAYLFSTDNDEVLYNPLSSGGFTSKKDRIIELREWSEEHYKKLAEGFLQMVFKVMDECGVHSNLSTLSHYLDIPNLKNLVRENSANLDDPERLMDEILEQEGPAKDISSLKAEIRNFVNSEIGSSLKFEEGKPVIELKNIIQEAGVVYFSLPATEFPTLSKVLGKLIINDLKAAINALSKESDDSDVFVIFDEFSVFAGEQVLNLINQGRSKGVHAILATQCLSDIARGVSNGGEYFMNQILENCNNYIIHRLNSYEEAERMAKTIGTRKKLKYTAQFDDQENSEKGSVRTVDEFNVHPNDIKNLPVGQAFVVSKTQGLLRRIQVRLSWILREIPPEEDQ